MNDDAITVPPAYIPRMRVELWIMAALAVGACKGKSSSEMQKPGEGSCNVDGDCVMKCDAKDVPNDAKKTVQYDKASTGYRCSTGEHMTDDWNLVVSASGNATLTCKFKFPKP